MIRAKGHKGLGFRASVGPQFSLKGQGSLLFMGVKLHNSWAL